MTLSLNSKEGRSILTSLAGDANQGAYLAPEAGRGLVGTLGFRLVGLVRQIFQSPSAYQDWLNDQRNRVAKEFIFICQAESISSFSKEQRQLSEGASVFKRSELSGTSLEKLRNQSGKFLRPGVLKPSEFESMLTPTTTLLKNMHYSGLQRLISFLNPFDQHGERENDWLSQFRNSGQALKIEMTELLELYYGLLQSSWKPIDKNVWVSVGARLIQINDELAKLCQSAEELVLAGLAKEAGFNLSLIFALLKGLVSERVILAHLIANPQNVQEAKTWQQAVTIARSI